MHTPVASHTKFRTWGGQKPTASVLHLLCSHLASRLLQGQHLDLGLDRPGHSWRRKGCGTNTWGPGMLPSSRPGPGPVNAGEVSPPPHHLCWVISLHHLVGAALSGPPTHPRTPLNPGVRPQAWGGSLGWWPGLQAGHCPSQQQEELLLESSLEPVHCPPGLPPLRGASNVQGACCLASTHSPVALRSGPRSAVTMQWALSVHWLWRGWGASGEEQAVLGACIPQVCGSGLTCEVGYTPYPAA